MTPGAPPATKVVTATEIRHAVKVLRRGGLVGLPTETVYGLAADARNPRAVAGIFSAKERPADHPLIVHLHDAAQLSAWARHIPLSAWQLAEAFWPGPLTMILPRAFSVLDSVTGGLDTVALRVPAHPVALQVLDAFGGGLAAPSANRHKKVSPTCASDVREELGDAVDLVLDGGPCRVGIESTIVDLSQQHPCVLRPGAITLQQLREASGQPVEDARDTNTRCPGRMASHYAPHARVVLATPGQLSREIGVHLREASRVGVLASERLPAWPAQVAWLPWGGSDDERARRLYSCLRQADRMGLDVLMVALPADDGLGHALRDRLRRAAGLGDGPP